MFLQLSDSKETMDNASDTHSVSNGVSFGLDDGDDVSDADSKSVSLMTVPAELKQYVGAEGGDDISLYSRNGNDDSSCDSLADADEISQRYFPVIIIDVLYDIYWQE